jgi:hypothetical protein
MESPAPGQRPGMPPAGGPGGAPAPGPGGMPMQPMVPHQVIAMQPRPYPNPMQMANPVGLAGVMRQQMMAQQEAPAPKGKAAAPEKKEPPAA